MDRLNHSRKQKQLAPVKPCDVFDLIGGTSTGGLIAIMLGRLEMSVDECIKAYSGLIATVFGVQLSKIPMNWKGKVKPRFDSAKLEVAIKQVISQSGLPEDTMFDDGIERGCKTFVCSIDRHTKAMVRLRSYSLPDEQNVPATICQAALATSAATTFFAPVNIGKRSFADGAFGANNPVDEVEGEATNIWSPEMRELQPLVKCFISIGTGNPGIQAFEDGVPKFLGGTVPQIATETEATDRKFIARWARHFDEKRYFRFNVEQGLQGVGLAEYELEGAIQAASEAYLTHTGQKSRVRDCVGNLSLKQKKTDESFATIQREYVANVAQCLSQAKAARRTFYDIPPTAVSSFSGRKEILKQIDIAFSQVADATTKPPVLVLQAMGGQGKSQIALEYCRRSRSRFQAIFWIDATSDASVQGGFERIAKKFDPLAATGPRDRDEKIDLVQKKLANLEEEWLLVFDNYDDLSSYKLRPYLPTNGRGFIILTSRHEASGGYARPDKGNFLAVPSMEHDGGHVLLQNKLSGTNEQERSELLQRLGGLALAIDQAAAYISFHKLSIPDFMAAYESRKVKILQHYEETDWEYNKHFNDSEKQIALTAYTTWEMSFQQVEPANPGRKEWITQFLSISAFLHPARIGEHIFREYHDTTHSSGWLELFTSISNNGDGDDEAGPKDSLRCAQKTKSKWLRSLCRKIIRKPKRTSRFIIPGREWKGAQFQEVTRNLEQLSLISNTGKYSKDTGPWFSVHPVIRDWLQIRMKSNLRQETLVESIHLVKEVVALEVTKVAGADVNQELLNHVDILVDPLKALCKCGFLDDVLVGDSAIKFGYFYLHNGHRMKAIELLEYALDVVRASSAADKLVLRLGYTLAVVYNRDRQSSKATELLEHVVRVQDLEETHPDRLASQHELAIAYQENGQVKDAIKLLEHVVAIRETCLTENHPGRLASQHALARAYRENEQVEDAIKLLEHVVTIRETSLTENHRDRLASQHSLAVAYQENGQVEDAIKLLEHVAQVWQGIDEDHPRCLYAQHVLAVVYIADGQAGRGIELLEHVVQVHERTKTAENDPWYREARYELAEACQERDRNIVQ
ncbi:FabD/lysophospholipase-like protein [Aureobasidium pullulans]|nr:FabD/lysophospholipase-like protein [Aureobasidium pullulans]